MVIVELKGGLGNQMFQYATARAMSKAQPVYIDYRFLNSNNTSNEYFTARQYELYIFKNIDTIKANRFQHRFFKSQSFIYKVLRYLFRKSIKYVHQQNEHVVLDDIADKKNIYLDGYFQSEDYFKNIREDILHEFQFPQLDAVNETFKEKIKNTPNAVSLHVRRADYLKPTILNTHGILHINYYNEAINILKTKYPELTLFVFSDDIEWAKSNFKNISHNIYFITSNSGENSWKDMALMRYCNHHIIANSSFSWWGAWLNPLPGKTIIAPKKWFNDPELNLHAGSIIPNSWISI